MEDSIKKLPITPTLKCLEVGESCSFPLEQRTSVYVSCQRLRKEYSRIGWDYILVDHVDNFTVEVKRKS